MRLRELRWGFLVVLAMHGLGCAAFRAASARHEYIKGQTQEHVYNSPVQEVWSSARQMLFEKGYAVKDTGEAGAFAAETEWKQEGKSRSRYLLTGVRVDDAHSRVQFTRAVETQRSGGWDNDGAERDLEIEFDLIERVEPGAASQINKEADAKGEKASG